MNKNVGKLILSYEELEDRLGLRSGTQIENVSGRGWGTLEIIFSNPRWPARVRSMVRSVRGQEVFQDSRGGGTASRTPLVGQEGKDLASVVNYMLQHRSRLFFTDRDSWNAELVRRVNIVVTGDYRVDDDDDDDLDDDDGQ